MQIDPRKAFKRIYSMWKTKIVPKFEIYTSKKSTREKELALSLAAALNIKEKKFIHLEKVGYVCTMARQYESKKKTFCRKLNKNEK